MLSIDTFLDHTHTHVHLPTQVQNAFKNHLYLEQIYFFHMKIENLKTKTQAWGRGLYLSQKYILLEVSESSCENTLNILDKESREKKGILFL